MKKKCNVLLKILSVALLLAFFGIGSIKAEAAKKSTYFLFGDICYKVIAKDKAAVCGIVAKYSTNSDETNWKSSILQIPSSVIYKGKKYKVTEIVDQKIYFEGDSESENTIDGRGVWLNLPRYNSYQYDYYPNMKLKRAEILCEFKGADNIRTVILPNTLTYIGEGAFCGCPNLEKVVFARKYKKLTVGVNAFSGKKLKSIIFPEGTYELKANAAGMTQNITIPSTVKKIGYGVVNASTEKVTISKKNKKFKMKDGILYSKDEKTLLGVSASVKGTVKISSKTKNIAKNAFACSKVKEVVLNKKITKISKGTFAYCIKLKKVLGTESVTNIDYAAFAGCKKLTSIGKIPKLVNISRAAFWGADKLKIELSANIRNIDTYAFSGTLIPTEVKVSIVEENPVFFVKGGFLIKKEGKKQTVLLQLVKLAESDKIIVPEGVTDIPVAIRRKGYKEIIFPTTIKYHDAAIWGEGGTVVYLAKNVPEFGENYGIGVVNATSLAGNNIEIDYANEIGSDKRILLIVPKGSLQEYKKAITNVYSVREEDRVWTEDGKYVTIKER